MWEALEHYRQKKPKTLKNITVDTLNTLFLPIPVNENIQLRSAQIYGTMGSGKTSLYRYLANVASKRYGLDSVNAIRSEYLDVLIDNMTSQPVQALFLDDAGLDTQQVAKKLIGRFTQIRHILSDLREDANKNLNGVIIVHFAVQDYFLLDKTLRNTLHVEILKHAPTNKSDLYRLQKDFGSLAVKTLKEINTQVFRKHNYDYLSVAVSRAMDIVGIFKYPFVSKKSTVLTYLQHLPSTPTESISSSSFSFSSGDILFKEIETIDLFEPMIKALEKYDEIIAELDILEINRLKHRHVVAMIERLMGSTYDNIAESHNVSTQALTNSYSDSGWLATVRTELIGHLTEWMLIQPGQHYENYERIAGKGRVDLIHQNGQKVIEVKCRHRFEKPTDKMICAEMSELLFTGEKSCELIQVVVRKESVKGHIYQILKKDKSNQSSPRSPSFPSLQPLPPSPPGKETSKDKATANDDNKSSEGSTTSAGGDGAGGDGVVKTHDSSIHRYRCGKCNQLVSRTGTRCKSCGELLK